MKRGSIKNAWIRYERILVTLIHLHQLSHMIIILWLIVLSQYQEDMCVWKMVYYGYVGTLYNINLFKIIIHTITPKIHNITQYRLKVIPLINRKNISFKIKVWEKIPNTPELHISLSIYPAFFQVIIMTIIYIHHKIVGL